MRRRRRIVIETGEMVTVMQQRAAERAGVGRHHSFDVPAREMYEAAVIAEALGRHASRESFYDFHMTTMAAHVEHLPLEERERMLDTHHRVVTGHIFGKDGLS